MRNILIAAAVLAALPLVTIDPAAAAAPARQWTPAPAPLVTSAHYPYCRAWVRECAFRWGAGTWRFRRCLAIRGC